MESETPQSPAPENANQPEIDPTPFRWNAMIAPPWDPGTYYFFLLSDNVFYEAEMIGYPLDFARNLHSALSHFCAASSYAGLHKTIERISADMVVQGQEAGEATLMATLAAQLIQHGILHFLPDFTHVLIHAVADEAKNNTFLYPTSPMHIWAFGQVCEYLEKDLLPMFELKDGGDSYPFGEIAEIKQAVQNAHKILSAEIAPLMESMNPYKQISDLRAIGEILEQQQPEQPS